MRRIAKASGSLRNQSTSRSAQLPGYDLDHPCPTIAQRIVGIEPLLPQAVADQHMHPERRRPLHFDFAAQGSLSYEVLLGRIATRHHGKAGRRQVAAGVLIGREKTFRRDRRPGHRKLRRTVRSRMVLEQHEPAAGFKTR